MSGKICFFFKCSEKYVFFEKLYLLIYFKLSKHTFKSAYSTFKQQYMTTFLLEKSYYFMYSRRLVRWERRLYGFSRKLHWGPLTPLWWEWGAIYRGQMALGVGQTQDIYLYRPHFPLLLTITILSSEVKTFSSIKCSQLVRVYG